MNSFFLLTLGLLPHAIQGAPMPQAADITQQPTPTRTYALSGSLTGPTSLLGDLPGDPQSTQDTTIPEDQIDFAPGQEDDTTGVILDFTDVKEPQPIAGTLGGTDPGPRQNEIYRDHPDVLAAPPTDTGDVPQLQWPMALSNVFGGSNRAGWTRQQNVEQLPAATDFAGVNMRLEAGGYRELHWHTSNEWAYVLNGSARVQAMNDKGQTFIDDLNPGDVWFFPKGVPHYLQGLENGTEFLLIFDDGNFAETSTFLLRDMVERNPPEVWSKDMDLPTEAFTRFPTDERFIFNGTIPPRNISEQTVTGPAGAIPDNSTYSFHWSLQEPLECPGGSVKILDSRTFPIVKDFSAAQVTIKPGALREVHWHGDSDEWNFFIQGSARITVFTTPDNSRTFDYHQGDVGYIPISATHYVENIGDDDVVFLEVLKQAEFSDFSVAQMLGLLPPQVTKDHLSFTDEEIAHLSKEQPFVVQGKVPSS